MSKKSCTSYILENFIRKDKSLKLDFQCNIAVVQTKNLWVAVKLLSIYI